MVLRENKNVYLTFGLNTSNLLLVLYKNSVAFKNDCDAVLLYGKAIDICNYLSLLLILPFSTVVFCLPYGTDHVDHLAADGTRLTGGQIAVITLLEVDADFP